MRVNGERFLGIVTTCGTRVSGHPKAPSRHATGEARAAPYDGFRDTSSHQQRHGDWRYPRHQVFTPGSPSRFRPRNPPSLALARTASRSVKGGRVGFGVVARRSPTAISAGETATVGAGSGSIRAGSVIPKSRQERMEYRVIARSSRSRLFNGRSSTWLPPGFTVKCQRCRVKDWRGIGATRLPPLPLRTAREVFPQAAHPISFVNRVRRPMAVADPFSDIRRRF